MAAITESAHSALQPIAEDLEENRREAEEENVEESVSVPPVATSFFVALRIRPPTEDESRHLQALEEDDFVFNVPGASLSTTQHQDSTKAIRRVVQVIDDTMLSFDPPPSTIHTDSHETRQVGKRKHRDLSYQFDMVFDDTASQENVFEGTAKSLIGGVLDGYNATIFAYGVSSTVSFYTND